MVLYLIGLLNYYFRSTSWLHYEVLTMIVGSIFYSLVLTVFYTLMMVAVGILAVISYTVNPPAPPYNVVLLLRQVRIKYGLTKAVTHIDKTQIFKQQRKITCLTIPR